jgi:hypothetical protein
MPAQKKKTSPASPKKAAPVVAKKAASAAPKKKPVPQVVASKSKQVATKAARPQPLVAQQKTVVKKTATKANVKANVKAKAKDSGIHLLQLSVKGQPTNDPLLKAYQPSAGGMGLSELLDGLCMAQQDPALQKSTVWGLLTPDFTKRTSLTGQDLLTVIQSNPGFDLYYASAHPELEAIYHNPWRSPEVTHPEFVALSRRFLQAAGLSDVPVDSISHSSLFATGHLMVASPGFWEKYVGFVQTVFSQVQKSLNAADQEKLFSEPPVPGRMTYLALIIARLLSVFLMLKNSNYRAFKIPLPEQEKTMNTHLRFLREMKDLGLTQKSKWHLAAWVNYRGLYLAHVMGKAWIMKHIQSITPSDLLIAVPTAQVHNPYTLSRATVQP